MSTDDITTIGACAQTYMLGIMTAILYASIASWRQQRQKNRRAQMLVDHYNRIGKPIPVETLLEHL